jgi:3-hydroxymyristoyl/3-hydroxydecanoyl-(acyl carrier protein) dehydratase
LGPRDHCTRYISEILKGEAHLAVAFDANGVDPCLSLIKALAKLVAHGIPVDLSCLEAVPRESTDNIRSLQVKVNLGDVNFRQKRAQARAVIRKEMSVSGKVLRAQEANSRYDAGHPLQVIAHDEQVAPSVPGSGSISQGERVADSATGTRPAVVPPRGAMWDRADLLEFAEGSIARIFGHGFAAIDQYRRRVRLPAADYLFVSRVVALDATPGRFEPSRIVSEYDIPEEAPYLIDGRIPLAVAIESGQCDLLLISYLGIDHENRGERVYRLLDCTLTFVSDMPAAGETLRYDIRINSFARNGRCLLFFFSYECHSGGRLVLKMDGGCAGFFSDEELAGGKGVIVPRLALNGRTNVVSTNALRPLTQDCRTALERNHIECLQLGDVRGCFGEAHGEAYVHPVPPLSSPKFLMLESVSQLAAAGGNFGKGYLVGHKLLAPDHWYFPCHFVDDPVLAGSLIADGCQQLLKLFMLYMGLGAGSARLAFQPIHGLPLKVVCRGQVVPQHGTLLYRMHIKDVAGGNHPSAAADVDVVLNDKVIVAVENVGLRLVATGSLYAPLMKVEPDTSRPARNGVTPIRHFPAPVCEGEHRIPDRVPFNAAHLFEFATGDLALCFGPEFALFRDRVAPRTPCGDLQLISRVVAVEAQRHNFNRTSRCVAEYEAPANAWYFRDNTHPGLMPYAILMEIALQPNGFLSTYVGTSLLLPNEGLYFRNLDGEGTLLKPVDLRGRTIVNESVLTTTVRSGSNIIQRFTFDLKTGGTVFYRGSAAFGYFTAETLAHQAGLDNGRIIALPKLSAQETVEAVLAHQTGRPAVASYLRLAKGQLRLIDRIRIVPGAAGAAASIIYAEKDVHAGNWFFRYHFHDDPVMPGSLGVESMLEAIQIYLLQSDHVKALRAPRFIHGTGKTTWKYRGQISPLEHEMTVEIHIQELITTPLSILVRANANLYKNGLRIYQVSDLRVAVVESD